MGSLSGILFVALIVLALIFYLIIHALIEGIGLELLKKLFQWINRKK